MPIPYVTLTPPTWIRFFAENLVALKAIQGQTEAHRPDLKDELHNLIRRGDELKGKIWGVIQGKTITPQNAAAIYKGFEPIEQRAHDWLGDVAQFEARLGSNTELFGVRPVEVLQQAGAAAKSLEDWANSKVADPLQKLRELWAGIEAAERAVSDFAAGLWNLPWLWIGAAVLAVWLLPSILDGGEE